jgi:HEAT repeat protein
MANRRSYKTDTSFLEKISIGAVGTRRVFDDLQRQKHNPIELERGSMSFKIWKAIKIKRIRVPDILCIDCGSRVESRAKTKLAISMSHSFTNQERGWDYGLEDTDFVALVVCKRAGEKPVDWQADELVQYIAVRELRAAQDTDLAVGVQPKGAEEGFEARITWPSSVASAAGVVKEVTDVRLQYRRQNDGRTITLKLSKQGLSLTPLVQAGETIGANQILASVVPIIQRFPCPRGMTEESYVSNLSSPSLSDRYTASKALRYFRSAKSGQALLHKMSDTKDHIYVRLEAAASLAQRGNTTGLTFVESCLTDQYLENRLEAVIVLGEIGGEVAGKLLVQTLNNSDQHPEIRAGAAWVLGELHNRSTINTLIDSFLAVEDSIRIEAARALAKLAAEFTPEIVNELPRSAQPQRPGIAWALSKSSRFTVEQLLTTMVDDDVRRWIAYIIGTQNPESYIEQMEVLRLRDPEVYFAVTVLWQIMSSWVYDLKEYG